MSLANLFEESGATQNAPVYTAPPAAPVAAPAAASPAPAAALGLSDPGYLSSIFGADWQSRAANGTPLMANGYQLTPNMTQNSADYSGSEYVPGLGQTVKDYSLFNGTGQGINHLYGADGTYKSSYQGSDQGILKGVGDTLVKGAPLILGAMAGFGALGGMTGAGAGAAAEGLGGLSGMDMAADASSGFLQGTGYIPGASSAVAPSISTAAYEAPTAVGGYSTGAAPGELGSGSFGVNNVPGLSDLPTGGALGSGGYGVPGVTGGASGAGITGATDWLGATGGGLGGAGMAAAGGALGAAAGGGGSTATATAAGGAGTAASGTSITGNPIIDKIITGAGSSALSGALGGGTGTGASAAGGALSGLGGLGNVIAGGVNYAQQQALANRLFDYVNSAKANINNLYQPGSPEYKTLWDQMSAKDAAAGRNSQYGTRTVDFMGKTAATKAAMQVDLAKGLSGMFQTGATAQANAPAGLAAGLGSLLSGTNGTSSLNSIVQNLSSYLNPTGYDKWAQNLGTGSVNGDVMYG